VPLCTKTRYLPPFHLALPNSPRNASDEANHGGVTGRLSRDQLRTPSSVAALSPGHERHKSRRDQHFQRKGDEAEMKQVAA
jgi:hypothetical protein